MSAGRGRGKRLLLRWLSAPTLLAGAAGCGSTPVYQTEPIPAFLRPDIGLSVQPPEFAAYKMGVESTAAGERGPEYAATAPNRPSVVSLAQVIQETIVFNLRLRAGMEKVQAARADLTNAAIIPNPTLTLDRQFLTNNNEFRRNPSAGPPQYDAQVNFPLDWYVYGKRVAAMTASRLGVDVAAADYADAVRKQVSTTLDAVYDILEARALQKLFQQDLDDLRRIEKITAERLELKGGAAIDLDRARLAVLDAQREQRRRDLTVITARSRLRPLLGRLAPDPNFDVAGELGVAATLPAPALADAIALAEMNRPDILSDRRDVERALAAVATEERKAYPSLAFQTGATYQQTQFYTRIPGVLSANVWLTSGLPFTDRNQGGIARAKSDLREKRMTLQADLAELRAEVEQALETYRVAQATVTADDPATLKAARDVRDRIEAAYKLGGVRLLEVLDAQRAYRERLRASLSAQADYWRALNRLNAALGVRLQSEPEAPELLPEPKGAPEK
jgi:cobalt-zinc-cadmium efflux system outer membrane protein